MNALQRWAFCALLFGAALSAVAQDELLLGSPLPAAPGDVVRVPVFLSATPLDAGGPPIQWIDLSITHSHPHLVVGCLGTTYPNCDLQFEAAGLLAANPPETSGTLINIASLYVRRIFGKALPVTGGLDLLGFITFRLDPNAPLGTVIRLQFDPAKTFLANHDGTIVDRGLKLTGTSFDVKQCPKGLPGTPSFDFFGPVSGCFPESNVSPSVFIPCRAGEDIEFSTVIPIDACDTLTWSFGDGTVVSTNGSSARHRFTLSSSQIFGTTYTVSAVVTRASGSATFSRQVSIVPGCTATVPETAVAGTPVSFTADTVPSGFAIFVSWKFGDGTTGSGSSVQHTYPFGLTYLWEAMVGVVGMEVPCIVRRPIVVSGPSPPRQRVVR